LNLDVAPAPAGSGVHFAWLDPLRGFAALSVLAAHLVMLAALPIPTWYPVAWFRIGFLGVDLFFAISGAVILLSLAELHRRHGSGYARPFAWRRVARIVPLYLLTCTAFVLLVRPDILQRPDVVQVVLAHLFFVQNLFPSTHGVINGPSWTLGVEMQFYLLMLLLGPWLLRLSLLRLAALGLALGVGWRALVWWHLVHGEAASDPNLVFIYSTQLPGVIDEFVGGMVAARWWMQRRERGLPPGSRLALGLGLAALLAWAGVIAAMHAAMPVYWTHPASVIGLRCGFALAAGLSVAAVLACPAPRRGRAAWRLGGDLSYGIYLWHMGVLLLLQGWLADWNPWAFGAAVLGVTLLLSALGWFLVERPAMRRVRASAAAQ
jgi:peptidoglycan/LPS O-acetylase OafA/YrhL